MRAHGREGRMGKRFALVIGVAAAGVMALGAQTASAGIVHYDTTLTITKEGAGSGGLYHGQVKSEVNKCMKGRRVVVFKRLPGADRKLGTDRSRSPAPRGGYSWFSWKVNVHRDYGNRVYARVKPKVRDRYVCRADRSNHFHH
jgi:hypothetical protein